MWCRSDYWLHRQKLYDWLINYKTIVFVISELVVGSDDQDNAPFEKFCLLEYYSDLSCIPEPLIGFRELGKIG